MVAIWWRTDAIWRWATAIRWRIDVITRRVARAYDGTDGGLLLPIVPSVMREWLTSDLGVYLLSGLFSLVVFLGALGVLSVSLPDGLGRRRTAGLVVGYLLFVVVYTIAWYIYAGIDAREQI